MFPLFELSSSVRLNPLSSLQNTMLYSVLKHFFSLINNISIDKLKSVFFCENTSLFNS